MRQGARGGNRNLVGIFGGDAAGDDVAMGGPGAGVVKVDWGLAEQILAPVESPDFGDSVERNAHAHLQLTCREVHLGTGRALSDLRAMLRGEERGSAWVICSVTGCSTWRRGLSSRK